MGELALTHETLDLPGDDELSIAIHSAENTPAADALKLLASRAATQNQETTAAPADSGH